MTFNSEFIYWRKSRKCKYWWNKLC